MSRENPFAKLDMAAISASQTPTKPGYGMTGAAKTVVRSIEDMAENTKKLMEGEVIVDLDPRLIDASFVADRLSDNGEEFQELLQAIRDSRQTTPILVRPSSTDAKRYMVVFGHRRLRVARELGVPVKAIVKQLDDTTSAVVQGQENAARSNLSFIERAYFAQNLIGSGMTKETVRSSLAIDEAMLSKMLAVIEAVPASVITALGASKKIGRDRWLSLRQLVLAPALSKVAIEHVESAEFQALPEGDRFDKLHDHLKRYKARSVAKKLKAEAPVRDWTSTDRALNMMINAKAKKVAIELTNSEARPFSEWLSSHMGRLYEEYKGSKTETNGD